MQSPEPLSPPQHRVLFDERDDLSAALEIAGPGDNEADPGVEVHISAEGYADNTYMLAMCIMTLQKNDAASHGTVGPGDGTGDECEEIHAFWGAGPAGDQCPANASDGEKLPVQHEF